MLDLRELEVFKGVMRLKNLATYSTIFLLVILTNTISIVPVRAFGQDTPNPTVLVIQSYHPQLSWVKSIDRGIRTFFEKENPDVQLRFEYMDTKRITDPSYTRILFALYKFKFSSEKFDVIICSDNNALNFLLQYRDILFPNTPVVFCGINNFSDGLLAGKNLFTGTVEELSIKEILDEAIVLHPAVKQIFFYGDNSTTYYANKALVEHIGAAYRPDLQFNFINNLAINQIQEQVQHLGKDSLILLGATLRDENSKLLSFEKSVSMIEEVSTVPIYGFWDFYLGHGIVGGKLVSGFAQGKTAAEIANRILNGAMVADIPVVRKSPNQYMFDNKQLVKFNIDPSLLPAGSIIINRQPSYFTSNKQLIISGFAVVAVLIIINSFLIFNIRSRRRAQKKLAASEGKYRNLLESTSIVPWELDGTSGKFTYMGKQIEQVLGYPAESWADMDTWAARIYPEDKEEAVEYCAIETQKRHDHDFVYRAVHMDGSIRWIRDIVSVIADEDGSQTLIGFMHDITTQKELAEEKQNLESRLVQAQKMEAIGTLAGGIAHDFNNVLAAILGYTEMAKEEAPAGTQLHEDLAKVMVAGNRAKDLVKQILAFSRQAEVERIPLRLEPLIKEGLKMLRSSIPTTISIVENIDPKGGVVFADPTQVHQILMNLCTNAYQAMEDTGGALSVTLKNVRIGSDEQVGDVPLTPGDYVECIVADTGVGIGPDTIEKIFDPYFTTKAIGKGTGMGLAISHGIMKKHGGTITVESILGKGSVFHVYFPIVQQQTVPEKKEPQGTLNGQERILFVDDEELLAEMGKELLERLGYHVTVERSSLEALYLFQNTPENFDLVITDQTMPDMTGAELATRMMQIRPDIPIILCTGYSNLIDEESAKNLGIKEFAFKPLTKEGIAGLIRRALV